MAVAQPTYDTNEDGVLQARSVNSQQQCSLDSFETPGFSLDSLSHVHTSLRISSWLSTPVFSLWAEP